MRKIESVVPGFEGQCYPTWLNTNSLFNRLDGGVSGFFKRGLFQEEFHGIILGDGKVHTTEGRLR